MKNYNDLKKQALSKVATLLQPQLRAAPMTLFPTAGSLQEVVDLSESKLPISSQNELFGLLMVYHNTLLKEVNGH